MDKNIFIVDDERLQVEGLTRKLKQLIPDAYIFGAHEEKDILNKIESTFYNLAIVDLRMDNYVCDGISIIEKIIEVNPFAKVIIVSAYTGEYISKINPLLGSGKILAVSDKKSLTEWGPELVEVIQLYFNDLSEKSSELSLTLGAYYSNAKNEPDSFKKGILFERFVISLLGFIGYKQIKQRVIDQSRNEVDLIVRNEISDKFLSKFGKYILVECKNYPNDGIGKNEFIQFHSKLETTNGLAELGILITSGFISKTTYIEAVRSSRGHHKIIFISNPEIERLINSNDIKNELKLIIDEQVKDN